MVDPARSLLREARAVTLRRFEQGPDAAARRRLAAALVALEVADEKLKAVPRETFATGRRSGSVAPVEVPGGVPGSLPSLAADYESSMISGAERRT